LKKNQTIINQEPFSRQDRKRGGKFFVIVCKEKSEPAIRGKGEKKKRLSDAREEGKKGGGSIRFTKTSLWKPRRPPIEKKRKRKDRRFFH